MRARAVADAVVVAIMRSKGDHFAKTRKHIVSLGLTLRRLAQPRRNCVTSMSPGACR
jgi:hypothetical protein